MSNLFGTSMQRAQRAHDAMLPSDDDWPDAPICDEIDDDGEKCGTEMTVTLFRKDRYSLTVEAKCPKCGGRYFHEDVNEP